MRTALALCLLLVCGAASAATIEEMWIAAVKAQTSPAFAFDTLVEKNRTIWQYTFTIEDGELQLAGGPKYRVWTFGGRTPGPTLVAREGDTVRLRVTNETATEHTIHSHGLWVPWRMDGVSHNGVEGHAHHGADPPALTIKPGETFVYEYVARPAGTHFYHCHVNTNEHLNRGMAGALIVLPRDPDPRIDHDEVLLLQEWNSRYARDGHPGHPREVNDADFFTINGRSFPETPPLRLRIGETARLRIINAGSQSHSIHLHGQTFLVTHKDGIPLPFPLEMDTVAIAPGERFDLLIAAANPGSWPLHCHTAAHQTNGGVYPGGMMMHVIVGDDETPASGDGPLSADALPKLRQTWMRAAARRLAPRD